MTALDLSSLILERNDALFLDLDGTLAEIGPDPDTIQLNPQAAADIIDLSAALDGAVAVISGRDLRDLASRTPIAIWRAGGHGLETVEPDELPAPQPDPPPEAILDALRAAASVPGVRLELKGPVAALHYRAAPNQESMCHAAAQAAAESVPKHVWQAGKMVVEVKPDSAHKGRAIRRFMQRAPFSGRRAIMIGDDTTDEDAMAAARELGGFGIKVGEGDTIAAYRTKSPATLRAWLRNAAKVLAGT